MIALALILAAAPARPLTLAEATQVALGADVSVARANIELERARLGTLRANLERVHASVDASVQELYDGRPVDVIDPQTGKRVRTDWGNVVLGLGNVSASVDVPLFTGFRVESDIERAEDLERAAGFDIENARRAVSLAVAQAYWSERRLALLEKVQASSTARLAESERVVQARAHAGLAAGLDENRAAARRAELEVEQTSLSSQRREAVVRLGVALGIDEPVELVDELPAVPDTTALDVDAFVQRGLDARPELKAAELRVAAVDAEGRAAQGAFWPQVGVGGLTELGNNPSIAGAGNRSVAGAAIPFAGTVPHVQAGVSVSVNLFDTWATTHAVDDAAHRRRLADADMRALRRQVESDVRLAHAKLVSLRSQRVALDKARVIEADDVDILQRAYERGEVLLTEVLDAQGKIADVERQIIDVDAQLALARLELDYAAGVTP